ncbi:AzlD domain-containing protein [Fructilactobacillus sanfranciscensis]|uniref:AzlD domain-containing protein n=1 Tax=Fructilactobacillus sanfranciscensis TaxID=1625 RepID=UPI0013D746A8|nr:AzlD domain-containing protein [Fructilactobacillus sanfranciscensis]NDR98365.1 AzlD domain-containing protein [Fructilactobacillus sanfranciscensis]
MLSFKFVLLVIVGCGLVTWLTRVIPFILLKKFELPISFVEFLSFVPVVIMSALWFNGLFVQHLGHLPSLNIENLLASIPTVISAIISKNLLVIVAVGILSLAITRFLA